MDYNTDLITSLAQQVAQVFQVALTQARQAGSPAPTIAEVEKDMRELLRRIGAEALQQFLSNGQGTPAAELPCACGGRLRYQRQRPATVTSVFGKITYSRAYYAGCACGQGKAPVDERYGLEPGAMTSGLAALLAQAGVELGFDESAAWLQAFLLFDVAANTVRSETQTFGALHRQREAALCQQSQDEAYLQARLRELGWTPLSRQQKGVS